MGFSGVVFSSKTGDPIKSLNGFYGIKITLAVIAIKITDFRGRGLANVKVEALNTTSGNSFIGFTDNTGNVFIQVDDSTPITITKNEIVKTVQYNGESSPTYTIDLPMIQNN